MDKIITTIDLSEKFKLPTHEEKNSWQPFDVTNQEDTIGILYRTILSWSKDVITSSNAIK